MNKFFKDDIIVVKAKRADDQPAAVAGQLQKDSVKKSVITLSNGEVISQVNFKLTLYDRGTDLDYIRGYIFHVNGKYATIPCVAYGKTGDYVASLEPGMQVYGAGVLRHLQDGDTLVLSGVLETLQPQKKGEKGRYDRIGFDMIKTIYTQEGRLPIFAAGLPYRTSAPKTGAVVETANTSFFKKGEKADTLAKTLGCDLPFKKDGTPYIRVAHFLKTKKGQNLRPIFEKEGQLVFTGSAQLSSYEERKNLEFIASNSFFLFDHNKVLNAPQAVDTVDTSDITDVPVDAVAAQPQVVSPADDDIVHDEWDLYY